MSGEATRWPVSTERAVSWGEMDALRHVNNAVYLQWFEDARMAYFDEVGMLEQMEQEGVGPILAKTNIVFHLPLRFPDRITASARVGHMGNTSIVMEYRVTSEAHDGAIAAEGEGVIVLVDYSTGKKQPLGESLRNRIHMLEKEAAEIRTEQEG